MYYGSTLSHHGILGQKWGIRRFQKYGGGLTEAGKRRYGGSESESGSESSDYGHGGNARRYANPDGSLTKEGIARVRAKRRGAVDDDFDADFEEVKKTVLSSGKASDVYELRGQITNKELQDAVARINWEKQLKQAKVAEQKTVFDTIETVGKRAQTVSNAISSVDSLINSTAKIAGTINKMTGNKIAGAVEKGASAASEAKKAADNLAKDIAKEADVKPKEKKGLFAKKDKEEKAEAKLEKEAKKADDKEETSGPVPAPGFEDRGAKPAQNGFTTRPGTVTLTREMGASPREPKEVNTVTRLPKPTFSVKRADSTPKTTSSHDDDDDMWEAYEKWTPRTGSAGKAKTEKERDWLAGQRWGVKRKKKKK